MKILLFGKNGQLGWELQRTCMLLGEMTAIDYPGVDLANSGELRSVIQQVKPDLILNAAAYTNVDKAEDEPEFARKVNALAPAIMAEEMKKFNGSLIHYSTDYVFDGSKGSPYVETDSPNPVNMYGLTKLEGEQLVQGIGGIFIIFRTSWVYSLRQGGFVTKVLQWARTQEVLRIVDDQVGSPTWARMLAEATAQVFAQGGDDPLGYLKEKSGLYHLAGAGAASRFAWAEAILELDPKKDEQVFRELIAGKTKDFPIIALRPINSSLVSQRVKNLDLSLPFWKHSLALCLNASLPD